jgi:ABC-type glycerol-3-phosphate transport system substrate-binding protein
MSGRRVSRREFLRLAALGGASVVAASCAPTPTPQVIERTVEVPVVETVVVQPTTVAATPQPVTLDFWFGWGGGEAMDACVGVADAFVERNPNVTINHVSHMWAMEKILAAFAGGVPPDVQEWGTSAEFSSRGRLLPLDPLIALSDVIKPDEWYEASWNGNQWGGALFAIPALEHGPEAGLVIQQQAVEEAGFDLQNPPETWDELYAWADAMTQRDNAGNVTQLGFDPLDAGANSHESWANSFGMQESDPVNLRYTYDDPRWVEILTLINDMVQAWGGPEQVNAFHSSFGGGWQGPNSAVCLGTQVMQVGGYWSCGALKLNGREDLDWTFTWNPVPGSRSGITVQRICGHVCFIPVESEHHEEAFHFLEFMCTDEACDIVFDTAGWLVPKKAWMDALDVSTYPGLEVFIAQAREATELYTRDPSPFRTAARQEFYNARDAVLYGRKTPEEAAAEMASNTAELRAEFIAEL